MAKYKEIASDLREKIKKGEYTYGQQLPKEDILCMKYGCNKETMKKALALLVKEGLIIRRRGAGTFVKEFNPVQYNMSTLFTRGLTARYKGIKKVTSKIIVFEVIPSTSFLANKLQIEEGTFVYHLIRLRYLDGIVHMIDEKYMPIEIIPQLRKEDVEGSLYHYIENELKYKIQSSHINITSKLSTIQEQDYLGLSEYEPYIQDEHISYLSTGQIFEYTIARYPYNQFEFNAIIIAE